MRFTSGEVSDSISEAMIHSSFLLSKQFDNQFSYAVFSCKSHLSQELCTHILLVSFETVSYCFVKTATVTYVSFHKNIKNKKTTILEIHNYII